MAVALAATLFASFINPTESYQTHFDFYTPKIQNFQGSEALFSGKNECFQLPFAAGGNSMLTAFLKDGGNSTTFLYPDDTDQAFALPSHKTNKPKKVRFPEWVKNRAKQHAKDPSLNVIQGRRIKFEKARVRMPITPKDKEWPCPERLRVDGVDAMHRAWKLARKIGIHSNKSFVEDDTFFVVGRIRPIFLPMDSIRQFIVDSGASYHLISPKDLTQKESKTIGEAPPMVIRTASKI